MDKNKYVASAEIRAVSVGNKPVIRCEIPYNQESENIPEVLMQGCFTRSIESANAGGKPVAALWSHDVGQPLGMFTTSDDGIPTSRDVSTGNTSSAITADGLIEAFYSLSPEHQKSASWIFHSDAVKMIRKLKDGDGAYIWERGLAADRPDTILGRPFYTSSWAPSTFTTGQYVGLVGDLSYYWIVDALHLEIQRLIELYAENNQVGFIGRLETDGQPVLSSAFARVTLA